MSRKCWKYEKTFLNIVTIVILLLSCGRYIQAAESIPSGLDLLLAANSFSDKIESGEGALTWTVSGKYWDVGAEEESTVHCDFSFSDANLRYDMYSENMELVHKTAIKNNTICKYDLQDGVFPKAIIRKSPENMGAIIQPSMVDYKRLCELSQVRHNTLLQGIKLGLYKHEVEKEKDGTFCLRVFFLQKLPDKVNKQEFILKMDPGKNFALVEEQYYFNEKLINSVKREYNELDGNWGLKNLVWERYNESGVDLIGLAKVQINDLELNTTIPDERFDVRGFDIPPETVIINKLVGVEYTLDPQLALDAQIDEVASELNSKTEQPVNKATKAINEIEKKEYRDEEQPSNLISNEEDIPFDRVGSNRIFVMIGIAVVIGVAAVVFWILKFKKQKIQ